MDSEHLPNRSDCGDVFSATSSRTENFSAEKFLAFSHLVGGAAILAVAFIKAPAAAPAAAVGDTPAGEPDFLAVFSC